MRLKTLWKELKATWQQAWNTNYCEFASLVPAGDSPVWDIEMPTHHNFFANDILAHNCHGITPTVKSIISALQADNPRLRVVGMTATPYRMNTGYIYGLNPDGNPVPSHQVTDPYFKQCVFEITARRLISEGYLTPPLSHNESGYDTSELKVSSTGKFTPDSVQRAFEGQGRLTADIVADVLSRAHDRNGIMFFAATVQHAQEVMDSLPSGGAALVTGETKRAERERILRDFKAQKIRCIVNVSVLTTGFDAPHVDCVAILRATESAGLLQQIIGRGLRLHDGKKDCLVLDYAGNIDRHCPDGDIFKPDTKTRTVKESPETLDAECPVCGALNTFTARPNPDGLPINKYGVFADLTGQPIEIDGCEEMPAHYGRRCGGEQLQKNGEWKRCGHRWSGKDCPECGHHNDIAARYCEECRHELVDPNEKLQADFQKFKSDPYSRSTDKVLTWEWKLHTSMKGNKTIKVTYTTEYRTFDVYYVPSIKGVWQDFCYVTTGESAIETPEHWHLHVHKMPRTVTVQRKGDFYRVFKHNEVEDEIPRMA